MRFRYCRSYCKLINNVLQRNKLLMFTFLCSCVYSLVMGRLLYQQRFMNPDLSTPTKFTGLSEEGWTSTKTELRFATFLPILDAFNPFVLQTFSRNLNKQLSCRGDVYGVLRKRRLYLSRGNFQELSYRGLERNKTRAKVYVVGETADKNGINLGFQGVIQHISKKCVHPNKPFITEGVGLVFYHGCEDSANRLVYVFDKKGRWLNSDKTMCVQPKGGLVHPPNRTPLEFSRTCGKASIFRPLSNGAIQHVTSGMCVHPNFGTAKPEDDELLVLYEGCHFEKLKFSIPNARSIETVSTRATQHRVNDEIIKLEILLASDTIKNIKTEYHAQVVEKFNVFKRHPRGSRKPSQFDILIIMFGSMSFANFQRTMPRVHEFLRNDLKSVIFPGFSLVGEGEFAQTEAILAGMRPAEMRNKSKGQHHWLFKMFQDSGYVTMATQDRLASGKLRKMMNRFGSTTVDHYPDVLWEQVYRNGNFDESALCHGSQFPFNISLSYLNSFLDSYRNIPKFAFMLNSALTRWNLNTARYAERPLLQFLKRRKKKLLKNTVLAIFGNHGWRGNGFRDTSQGKLEERLPFLSVTMPTVFREKYPEQFQNMVSNSQLLTSPLDIHATLKDLLRFSKKSGTNTIQNTRTTEIQGQSLFTKWDSNSRNCTSLGIPEHWCPCVRPREVNVSEINLKKISEVIVENLNYILKDAAPSGVCRKLYFKNLVSVKMLKILSKVRRYRTSESTPNFPFYKPIFWKQSPKTIDVIYQVDIRVQPGEKIYRTMVNLIQNDMYIEVKPSLISGTPAGCMKIKGNPAANYCECIERF